MVGSQVAARAGFRKASKRWAGDNPTRAPQGLFADIAVGFPQALAASRPSNWRDDRRLMSRTSFISHCQAAIERRRQKGIRYRSGVHSHRIRIPKGLQPHVSEFVRASI
jgi:hypothetical protein